MLSLANARSPEELRAWVTRLVATLDRKGCPSPVIDGLTGDQRFFIAYGYSWETKQREGALRAQLLTNEHSPAKYRVNGVVRNVDAWYKAFNVQPGDKMYLPPDQRVHVW